MCYEKYRFDIDVVRGPTWLEVVASHHRQRTGGKTHDTSACDASRVNDAPNDFSHSRGESGSQSASPVAYSWRSSPTR